MKNKRTFATLAVIIAVLVLGIGYAAVTKELTITGTLNATVDDSQFVVEFIKADDLTNINGTPEINGLSASFVVDGSKMKTAGNTARVTFTIKNSTETAVDLSAKLSEAVITNTNTSSKFAVEASDLSSKTLKPGEETTTTVVVSLNETPTEAISNETVTIKYIATAVQ